MAGSELLLLLGKTFEAIVGPIVLPVLGAVPDGAIVIFSGLGPIEDAQDQVLALPSHAHPHVAFLLTCPHSVPVAPLLCSVAVVPHTIRAVKARVYPAAWQNHVACIDPTTWCVQLLVGVGALAGSTIMLLTIPWALAISAGTHASSFLVEPCATCALP